jgi:hypothetical protein
MTTSAPRAVAGGERRAVVVWAVVVAAAVAWGMVRIAGTDQHLHAAPLVGRWRWEWDVRIVPAVAFAALVVVMGPRVAHALSWPRLVLASGGAATTWAGLLAARDGWATPFNRPSDYMRFAVAIDSPSRFLRTFTDELAGYPVHVKGHPPGATLAFWALDRAGLGGETWAALAVILAWGVAVAAVVLAFGAVAGRGPARRAAPFVALAPAAVWAGFSADALFAAVIATGAALIIVATTRTGARAAGLAGAGGVALAAALHLTYGAVPLLLVPAAVVLLRRRIRLVLPAAIGALTVTALFLAAGYWWFNGLAGTHEQYWAGVASRRPWTYYLVAANPAALALATGPALAAALPGLRRLSSSIWIVPAAALAAVFIANASGLSKGEVERIWLPFFPWLLTATATLPASAVRPWLAVQTTTAVALQLLLRSTW